MRYYTRFLLVGAASGFFCVFNYAKNGMAQTLADIVMLFGFSSADCQLNQIMEGTYWYMPLFLFQIFYGSYIYRHFCSASIYFFSRCCSRTRWFLKEALTLYLFAVVYLLAVYTQRRRVVAVGIVLPRAAAIERNGFELAGHHQVHAEAEHV